MDKFRIHARADAEGVVHLDLPIGEANSEVDLDVVVSGAGEVRRSALSNECDQRLFGHLLGDRVYLRRRSKVDALKRAK